MITMGTPHRLVVVLAIICATFTAQAHPTEGDSSVVGVREANNESQVRIGRNISIVGNDFMLDGKCLRIMSGSIDYFRMPSQYWRDRLRKAKAAGLNAVSTYVEWSSHEPEEGQTLFEGDLDLVRFIKIAEEEGLLVLLRPGPYICAERDLGGLPYWLLGKYPYIKLRTTDRDFINETKNWMSKLFSRIAPLLYGNGGPIIMVQVENKYGSYDADTAYMVQIRDIIKQHVGSSALLYTTDGYDHRHFYYGSVPETLTTFDFGCRKADKYGHFDAVRDHDVNKIFQNLREYMPVGPLMNSQYYPGWLTRWGEDIEEVATEDVVKPMKDMLANNMHFNMHMFFGGTNFEFSAGAIYYNTFYQPYLTSNDYDAPLTEAGDPTPKYLAIRNELIKYNPEAAKMPVPEPSKKGAYGKIDLGLKLPLLSPEGRAALGVQYKSVTSVQLPTFEELRQRGGLILYETTLNETVKDGSLGIIYPSDWIFVYVDNKLQGVICRMEKITTLKIKAQAGSTLSLLVENQGRLIGKKFLDLKGILSPVTLNYKSLGGKWTITGYPLNLKKDFDYGVVQQVEKKLQPALFEGTLTLPDGEEPRDTFIDPTGWGKGYIFVNGHNLGRYWPSVGPQVTLYLPGVWLNKAPAKNIIQLVELQEAPEKLSLDFIDYPILNRTGNIHKYFSYPRRGIFYKKR